MAPQDVSSPYLTAPMGLQQDWIDYNGHLNMAFYNVLFDRGCDTAFEELGLGPDIARQTGMTIYTAEIHVRYLREIKLGDEVTASVQILDHDEKRLHLFQELRHVDGWLSATSESIALHVDLGGPKVVPFQPDVMEAVTRVAERHAALPEPDGAGRKIEIRRSGAKR